jgi:hypothetical protein
MSVNDEEQSWRPLTRATTEKWQKFDIGGMCIRNLFHQARWWMENSFATFWGDWEKTFGANVQTSGATTPGPCIMTVLRLMHRSWCSSFWLLRRWQSFPTLPTHQTSSPVIFSYSQRWNWSSRNNFWQHWRDPEQIMGRDEDADAKWLPAVLRIMEIPLGLPYQCRRGLLWRGWKCIEISVSG